MDSLEQLNDFDFMSFSDIDDYLKPTNPTIKKDFVDSLTNLSNLISNGILFINYNIYENLSNQNNNNGLKYTLPKECKKLSEVISKGIRKDKLRNYENQSKNLDNKSIIQKHGIDIIVTDTNGDNESDEDYFGMNQSMIKPHKDFTIDGMDSSMLFDQSAIFSSLDLPGDHIGNQSMIFMDSNERDLFSNDDPANRSSMFLNINGLTDLHNGIDPEGNNSTLVNLTDVDNNYLSTSDIESNNSTAYWDDLSPNVRIPGPVNDPEEFSSEEDDQQLLDEFDQAFAKKKFISLDSSRDIRKLGNRKQKLIRHTYPSSAIQVNQLQVYPDSWNEYDDIKFAKANIKKQNIKNSFPHNKLYPVVETPYTEDDDINSSEFYSPSQKGFVNNYRNDNGNNINNSSFIKDDLSITKDIVNKNIKKFNSLGVGNDESFQKIDPSSSNFSFSNISFITSNDNHSLNSNNNNKSFASSNINRLNTPSPQPSASYYSSNNNNIINSVDNFEYLQSKFNQPIQNDEDINHNLTKSNHVWKYKTKQDLVESSIIIPEDHHHEMLQVQSSDVLPENINIKDKINNIEASLLIVDHDSNKENNNESIIEHTIIKNSASDIDIVSNNKSDSIDPSVVNSTIIKEYENENDLVIEESIGTVKDLITDLEKEISINSENKESEEVEKDEPIEFISDHDNEVENKEELIEYLSDNEENEEQPIDFIQDHDIDESIIFEKDAQSLINDNIIDGNLEDNIIIEEEDSIVGNAIEEALENKSFVIQENAFMDEPFANDLSYAYDGHAAFHEAMKFFEDGNALETIQEEDEEEDIEQKFTVNSNSNSTIDNKLNNNDMCNDDPNPKEALNEEKIFEMIENNINEPEEIINNDDQIIFNEDIIVKDDKLPLIDDQAMNPIPMDNIHNNNEVNIPEIESEDVVDIVIQDNNKTEKILSDSKVTMVNPKKVVKTKMVKKVPVKSNEISVKDKKPLEKSIKKTKPVTTVKKVRKSLVLPTKNLIPTIKKVDPLISNNCVKAFTSSSLKHNIINTGPIEHEVTVSFSDFDNIKPKPKPILKSKSKSKLRTKPIQKPIPKKSIVSGSNVKPLAKSKVNKIKPTKTISKTSSNKAVLSKTNKKLIRKKVAADPKILDQKNTNTIRKRTISRSRRDSNIFNSEHHITYFPKSKRKTIIEYKIDIQSKENIYYQWVKNLLPEYTHKFVKYELCEVMSKSFVFEALIKKLSPEYESNDYNPRRNIFKTLLPLDNINKFNEVLNYIQKQMKITVVITAYDLHFGNLSSIFIIIRQLQRYENNHIINN